MTSNPGRTVMIYDIPGIVAKALPLAVTHQNIVSGFECTGISPFNPDIFQEYKYLPSNVTDRENPSTSTDPEEANLNAAELDAADSDTVEFDAADQNGNEFDFTAFSMSRRGDTRNLSATLKSIRVFPKAASRQQTCKGRKQEREPFLMTRLK
ncbi:kinesin family member 21a [Lasius niger]|uniref:Kinesin family member 21a n=1 Tax=Lasius niger TaxID=67767 RepID=A0A0J7KCY6_LASNI|nr:kinesin family member 21a [Lasius niger]